MKVLVTGGSGFIGQALCPALIRAGHRPCVLTRRVQAARRLLGPEVELIERLQDATDIDAVVNLQGQNLAEGRWTRRRKQAIVDSRVAFTRSLVAWMRDQDHRPCVLISGSAIGWYADRGDTPVDEASSPGADFAAQLCRDWEAAAVEATAEPGLRVCCVRIGVVLHPAGGALAKMLPAFRLGAGGRLGSGRQWMSWISRDDLLRLLLWLLEDDNARGPFNAVAPGAVRQADFARALASALRRPSLLPMPGPILRLLLGEMAELLLGGQRVMPRAALSAGFEFDHPRIDTALKAMLDAPGSR